MLLSLNALRGSTLRARDGQIGAVNDCYFDDERWTVRYLVVDTGWLARPVLISPIAITQVDSVNRMIDVDLTREVVRNSPSLDEHPPVSRQYEQRYSTYYGYPPYWIGPGNWGIAAYPRGLARRPAPPSAEDAEAAARPIQTADAHIRSAREVSGYHIEATDGEVGHVDDFLADADLWVVRSLRVDTSNFIGGKAVLLPREAVETVSWREKRIKVALSKDGVYNSPEYDPRLLEREAHGVR
jgi:hypothetical protein